MNDLQTYFDHLTVWEGKPSMKLAATWDAADVTAVRTNFQKALERSNIWKSSLRVSRKISNQALGNRVADYFTECLSRHLRRFRIEPCSGQGYPDRRLVRLSDGRSFAFEIKATSGYDTEDDNRIVLTCASEKLRRHFEPPIRHLMVTVCYKQVRNKVRVTAVRLDFLSPKTRVRIRLEASLSKRLLCKQPGSSAWIVRSPEDLAVAA